MGGIRTTEIDFLWDVKGREVIAIMQINVTLKEGRKDDLYPWIQDSRLKTPTIIDWDFKM